MRTFSALIALVPLCSAAAAQSPARRPLTHDDNDRWNRIVGEVLSDDG